MLNCSGRSKYISEATLFSDFPLIEDLRRFVSGILHSHCLERSLSFSQQSCSYDWLNYLKTSYATNTFFFLPITLTSTCGCSVALELEAVHCCQKLEHLITAQCKSPKASHCLNFYCVLFLFLTYVFVRSCHILKIVCQA